ncbi:Hypothetical protein FKW44_015622, partial [Caligus rogercresseyi]
YKISSAAETPHPLHWQRLVQMQNLPSMISHVSCWEFEEQIGCVLLTFRQVTSPS